MSKLFWLLFGLICTIAGSVSVFNDDYSRASYWMIMMFCCEYNLDKLNGFGKD